jgi:S-adenosylmethionine:diacylglycerol 3-amino-3-carboxypropyl transferase
VIEGVADLRAILETLDPKARNDLRRVLIHDQANLDELLSLKALPRRERAALADIIDFLTMWPNARRRRHDCLARSIGAAATS